MNNNLFQIRVTGILVENGKILLVNQRVNENRSWSLPGGRLEHDETLENGIKNYIFEYSPFTNQGEVYVSFKVFNFDANNEMAVLESGSCTPKNTDAEFSELNKRIEHYMKNSTVIIDTIWHDPPLYSTSDKILNSYQ